jgi:hypothetical protein
MEGKREGVKLYPAQETAADACGARLTSPDGRKAEGALAVLTILIFAF